MNGCNFTYFLVCYLFTVRLYFLLLCVHWKRFQILSTPLTIEWGKKKSLCDSKTVYKKRFFFVIFHERLLHNDSRNGFNKFKVMTVLHLSFCTMQLLPTHVFQHSFFSLFISKKKCLKINNKFQVNLYVSLCCAVLFFSLLWKKKGELSFTYNPIKSLLEFMSLMRELKWCLFGARQKKVFYNIRLVVTVVVWLNEIWKRENNVEDRLLCIEWVVLCVLWMHHNTIYERIDLGIDGILW